MSTSATTTKTDMTYISVFSTFSAISSLSIQSISHWKQWLVGYDTSPDLRHNIVFARWTWCSQGSGGKGQWTWSWTTFFKQVWRSGSGLIRGQGCSQWLDGLSVQGSGMNLRSTSKFKVTMLALFSRFIMSIVRLHISHEVTCVFLMRSNTAATLL